MNEQQNEQENGHEELTRVIAPEVLKMSAVSRLISVFVSPGELMQNIKSYPVILAPLIICIIIGAASIPFSRQWTELYMQELSHISIEMYGIDLSGWSELQAADLYGDTNVAGIMDAITIGGLILGVVFGPLIVSLISALGLWILSKILKGSSTFGQLFSAIMHIYIIYVLGAFVVYGLTVMTGNFIDMTSLASIVMPAGNISMPIFNVLSAISVFSVWTAILTFIAVKVLNDFSGLKAGVIAVIAYAFEIAVVVGMFMFTFIMWDISARAMGLI